MKENKPKRETPLQTEEWEPQIRIRPMQPADAAQAAQIEQLCFTDPWSAQAFLDSLALPYTCFLAAEVPEEKKAVESCEKWKLVGYCGSYISYDEAEIVNVAVTKNERKKGIGRQMLMELLGNNAARGVTAFTLEVRVSNVPAIALYQSLGFQIEGIRRRFYENPVEDAYVMGKRLPDAGSNSH